MVMLSRLPEIVLRLGLCKISHYKSVTDQSPPSCQELPSSFSPSVQVHRAAEMSSCRHVDASIMCMCIVSMFRKKKESGPSPRCLTTNCWVHYMGYNASRNLKINYEALCLRHVCHLEIGQHSFTIVWHWHKIILTKKTCSLTQI